MFEGKFDTEVIHPHLGRIKRGTVSIEYFWLDRWFNVFRFHEPDGTFRNDYCNVGMPPIVSENVVDFVDLDIDLIVDRNGAISVLDEDEYEHNAIRFAYPESIRTTVAGVVAELKEAVRQRHFPFGTTRSMQHRD